jgi:hypothetical protein
VILGARNVGELAGEAEHLSQISRLSLPLGARHAHGNAPVVLQQLPRIDDRDSRWAALGVASQSMAFRRFVEIRCTLRIAYMKVEDICIAVVPAPGRRQCRRS